jgi:hypothetical protein
MAALVSELLGSREMVHLCRAGRAGQIDGSWEGFLGVACGRKGVSW